MINDIQKGNKLEICVLNKYEAILPKKLLELWKEYGYATILNGYMKVVNPDDYQELIHDSYFRGNVAIPVFISAFGDVITIEDEQYIGMVKFKNGDFSIIAKNIDRFIQNLDDEYFQEKYLELNQYEKAVSRLGELEYDECFGYVPLLGLGGCEKVENLQKVKIKEHIELITQLVGKIK